MEQVFQDYREADISDPLKATLGFLEKLTKEPGQVTTEDVQKLRDVGVTDEGVREAIEVCFSFSIMDRLADAFGFDLPGSKVRRLLPRLMSLRGYRGLG